MAFLFKRHRIRGSMNSLLVHTYVTKNESDFYYGLPRDHQAAVDKMEHHSENSQDALLLSYVKRGTPFLALDLYVRLKETQCVHGTVHTFVALLKACSQSKNLEIGSEIHVEIARNGFLEGDVFLGNTLVHMYIKCGTFGKAQEAFDKLLFRNAVSWTEIIAGYIMQGHAEKGLNCYECMQIEGVTPDGITLVSVLQACSQLGSMDLGQEIHSEITKRGLFEANLTVGNSLVDMYVKLGLLAEAENVFRNLPSQDVVSWTTVITGYAKAGCCDEAYLNYRKMQQKGIQPNAQTFVGLLNAPISAQEGYGIHVDIEKMGILNGNAVLGNALVDWYCRCCFLEESQNVFNNLQGNDVVSWNVLITGYVDHARGQEAMHCFQRMKIEGIQPNVATYASMLKAYGSLQTVRKGLEIHVAIASQKILQVDIVVGTAMVDMYVNFGFLAEAHEIFDSFQTRNVLTWNTLISGYCEHGFNKKALDLYEQMQLEGTPPDATTFVSCLKACGSTGSVEKGQDIHSYIRRKGLEGHLVVGTALVDMHAKCGMLVDAQAAFDRLRVRNVVAWNTLISGYSGYGFADESLKCLDLMRFEGVVSNAATFACILKSISSLKSAEKACEMHSEISRKGLLEEDSNIGNTLVDVYGKCDMPHRAQEVFDKLAVRTVFSWNALIAGYDEAGYGETVLECYYKMQLEGVSPDVVTYVYSLKACGDLGAIDHGLNLHAKLGLEGLLANEVILNTLLHMYIKCGSLVKAQDVFDKAFKHTVITWNVLISGYTEHDRGEEALLCFDHMKSQGLLLNNATLICSLKACTNVGAINKGQEIHAEIESKGYFGRDLAVDSALMEMYAKCGMLTEAHKVFDRLPVRGIVTWNTLIAGYAQCGLNESVCDAFYKMLEEQVKPDLVTFLNILHGCSQSGTSERCQTFFEAMSKDFGMVPTRKHHSCIIDLLGRAGYLEEATNMIMGLPDFCVDRPVWHSVLGASMMWGHVKLGRYAFEQAGTVDGFISEI